MFGHNVAAAEIYGGGGSSVHGRQETGKRKRPGQGMLFKNTSSNDLPPGRHLVTFLESPRQHHQLEAKHPEHKSLGDTLKPYPNHSTYCYFSHILLAPPATMKQDVTSQGIGRQEAEVLGAILKACRQRPGFSPMLPSVSSTSMIKWRLCCLMKFRGVCYTAVGCWKEASCVIHLV